MQGGDPRIIFDDVEKNSSLLTKIDRVKELLNRGVIVSVSSPDQARIAEDAGVKAVLVIGQAMNINALVEIKEAVKIPIMTMVVPGDFRQAKILESFRSVDIIQESLFFYAKRYIDKHAIYEPFVCACHNIGQVLNRVNEGTAMIRIQGFDELGNTMMRVDKVMGDLKELRNLNSDEVFAFARKLNAPSDLVAKIREMYKFPVLLYAAGGIDNPSDAIFMMNKGCDGVFVDYEVWKNDNPRWRLNMIVQTVLHSDNPDGLGDLDR